MLRKAMSSPAALVAAVAAGVAALVAACVAACVAAADAASFSGAFSLSASQDVYSALCADTVAGASRLTPLAIKAIAAMRAANLNLVFFISSSDIQNLAALPSGAW